MRKSGFFLPLVLLVIACSGTLQTTKIFIAKGISVSVPQKSDKIIRDSSDVLYHWETSFDDDNFAVFRYAITQSDSSNLDRERQIFKKNIDAFIQTFNFKKLDSTYQYNDNLFQCNLSFDFIHNDDDFKLFGKFLLDNNYFIVFCFQTPFPVDKFSKSIKDKLFNSIEIK
jgi:hypothetical protein